MYSDTSFDLAVAATSFLFQVCLVVLLIGLYLLVKAVSLIVRVLLKYPQNKLLWVLLASLLLLSALALLTKGDGLVLLLLGLSALALVIVAWIIETYYDDLLQKPAEPLISEVLHNPWWETKQAA